MGRFEARWFEAGFLFEAGWFEVGFLFEAGRRRGPADSLRALLSAAKVGRGCFDGVRASE